MADRSPSGLAASRPWLLPLVTTGGGLLAGLIVFRWAPEAEGHGTDAAIAAFHQGRPIRARVPLIKLIRCDWLPVVEERAGSRHLVGYVSARSILQAYQVARAPQAQRSEPEPGLPTSSVLALTSADGEPTSAGRQKAEESLSL